jgi:hypothetical protein
MQNDKPHSVCHSELVLESFSALNNFHNFDNKSVQSESFFTNPQYFP